YLPFSADEQYSRQKVALQLDELTRLCRKVKEVYLPRVVPRDRDAEEWSYDVRQALADVEHRTTALWRYATDARPPALSSGMCDPDRNTADYLARQHAAAQINACREGVVEE